MSESICARIYIKYIAQYGLLFYENNIEIMLCMSLGYAFGGSHSTLQWAGPG